MRTFVTPAAMVLSLALGASVATPQDSRPHYRRSVQATVDLVDQQSRIVEVKRPEGFYVRLHVPETFTKWDAIKVGNTVNVSYYENVILKIENRPDAAEDSAEAHGSPDSCACDDEMPPSTRSSGTSRSGGERPCTERTEKPTERRSRSATGGPENTRPHFESS